jgi:hypothetical protein
MIHLLIALGWSWALIHCYMWKPYRPITIYIRTFMHLCSCSESICALHFISDQEEIQVALYLDFLIKILYYIHVCEYMFTRHLWWWPRWHQNRHVICGIFYNKSTAVAADLCFHRFGLKARRNGATFTCRINYDLCNIKGDLWSFIHMVRCSQAAYVRHYYTSFTNYDTSMYFFF